MLIEEKNQNEVKTGGEILLDFVSIIVKKKRFFVFFVTGITLLSVIVA